jgi:hypothetical protein
MTMSQPNPPLPELMDLIRVRDHLMVAVVREDGEPGIYLAPGRITNEQAAQLLELMAKRLRTDPG